MTAKAVLLDLDGLLVDSEPLWTVAEEELARDLGGVWTNELKARIVGTRLDVSVPTILAWYGRATTPDAVAEVSQRLLDRMVELFATHLRVHDGAPELLTGIGRAGVLAAVVSSSYRVLVDAALRRLPPHPFALTLAGDEVRVAKPDPQPYLTAARRLGVDPRACVVLEDSPAGIASAEAAGCVAVAVPSVTAIEPTPRRPVLPSLVDLDVEWLLGLPAVLPVGDGVEHP